MGQFSASHYPLPKGTGTGSPQLSSVLVVDDEAALRRTLRASLATSGFAVEEAGTGAEALIAVRRRPFDLVLLDVNMPGLSGVEVCRQIRAIAPRTVPATAGPAVSYAQIAPIVAERCAVCHAAQPTEPGFSAAPAGILLDTPGHIVANAAAIRAAAVASHAMPPGNLTNMTDVERATLGAWIDSGAKGP